MYSLPKKDVKNTTISDAISGSGTNLSVTIDVNNTMAKRKRPKGQTVVYKTLHRKLNIEQHGPTKHRG
jgi:hypothetical protein